LTSPVARSHELIRHLAGKKNQEGRGTRRRCIELFILIIIDYVLVWSSDQQGDLGKSPHMARIGIANRILSIHC
jgi:hypothetical protein